MLWYRVGGDVRGSCVRRRGGDGKSKEQAASVLQKVEVKTSRKRDASKY